MLTALCQHQVSIPYSPWSPMASAGPHRGSWRTLAGAHSSGQAWAQPHVRAVMLDRLLSNMFLAKQGEPPLVFQHSGAKARSRTGQSLEKHTVKICAQMKPKIFPQEPI